MHLVLYDNIVKVLVQDVVETYVFVILDGTGVQCGTEILEEELVVLINVLGVEYIAYEVEVGLEVSEKIHETTELPVRLSTRVEPIQSIVIVEVRSVLS